MTTFLEGMGLVQTPLKDLVQEKQESGMGNSIIRSGQEPEVLCFPICKKKCPFARALANLCQRKEQELEWQSLWSLQSPLITGICRTAYDYKMFNNLFFFLGKDV